MDEEAAKEKAKYDAEWNRQLELLPEQQRLDIFLSGALSIYFEDLHDSVEKALAAQEDK